MVEACSWSCVKCGNQVGVGTRFCAYCGNPLKDALASQPSSASIDKHEGMELERILQLKAIDIMSRSVITVCEDDSLLEVARLIMRFRVSGLLVLSKNGRLVGVITATDLFFIIGKMGGESTRRPIFPNVQSVMTRDICTITLETPFAEIVRLMIVGNIHTLPVVENDNIVGVIGRRDVIYYYYRG